MLDSTVMTGNFANNAPILYSADGSLYFTFNDGTHGTELWASDGTSSGTQMVEDLNAGSTGPNPSYLTNVNGTLFFAANNGVYGTELWKIPSRLQYALGHECQHLENVQAASALVISPNASEVGVATNFQITNITGGTLYLNDDVTPVTDGSFITVAQGAAGLRFKPALNWTGAGGFFGKPRGRPCHRGLDGPLARAEITITSTADITSLLSPRGRRHRATNVPVGTGRERLGLFRRDQRRHHRQRRLATHRGHQRPFYSDDHTRERPPIRMGRARLQQFRTNRSLDTFGVF